MQWRRLSDNVPHYSGENNFFIAPQSRCRSRRHLDTSVDIWFALSSEFSEEIRKKIPGSVTIGSGVSQSNSPNLLLFPRIAGFPSSARTKRRDGVA